MAETTRTRHPIRSLYRNGVARVTISPRTTDEQIEVLLAFYREEFPANEWEVR